MSRWHRLEGVADLPDRAFSGIKIGGRVRITLEGGGGGETTSTGTTTSYQSNLPEFAEPYYKSMMARTQDESVTPFNAYTGDRVADFTTAQKDAQAGILGMTAPTGLADASAGFKDVAAGAKGASFAPGTFTPGYTAGTVAPGYTAGTMSAPEFNAAHAAKYMSPYQQKVIDVEKREATRQGAMAELGINAAAQQAGAFGGSRHGVVAAEHGRNLAQQLGDIQTKGQQQSYDRAAAQFGADRAATMGAMDKTQGFQQTQGQMGLEASKQNEIAKQQQAQLGMSAQQQTEASRQFGAKFEQANRDQQIKVGAAQADLAKSQQGLESARFNLQNAVGADQRKLAQQNLDKAFDDFVNKRDYERQQLSFYNSMLRGIEVGEQREVRQMQPAPSGLGQVAGAGLGALGAYNAFKGG